GDVRPDSGELARGFRTHDKRQLALGERHAAPAPHVDMVECDRAHPDLNLARRGRGGRRQIGELEVAVGAERERAHAESIVCAPRGGYAASRLITSETFWPPKPNEFESAWATRASRA